MEGAKSTCSAVQDTSLIGNMNSPSVASISSNESSESYVVEPEEMVVLSQEVKRLKDALGKLRKIFHPDMDYNEASRKAGHERLGEVLKILRHLLEKYPPLQSNELIAAAGKLIQKVKGFNYKKNSDNVFEQKELHAALDALASALSCRVSEYLMGDLETMPMSSPSTKKMKSCENLIPDFYDSELRRVTCDKTLTDDQIDAVLMQNDQGVDHALARVKVWSKYAKDVLTYVDKRTNMEFEFARNLAKLVQAMRPVLKEESFLPFQSIYCTGLDQDLEMCASMQATCSLIQGYKFIEPLAMRRAEHDKTRKALKEKWQKERKRIQEAVASLLKSKAIYLQRTQEYERCREALRLAEQGAEAGVAGENKIDKKKRLEEEALQKVAESELHYKQCVNEANERHHQLLAAKADILKQVRDLIVQCDQTMKAVTVAYFQLQHTLTAPVPVQFQTLCESSRLYEPGTQFMEYVKRLPQPPFGDPNQVVSEDPFTFEPFRGLTGVAPLATSDEIDLPNQTSEKQLENYKSVSPPLPNDETLGEGQSEPKATCTDDITSLITWTTSLGDGSDTESVESGKSSPTTIEHSMIPNNNNEMSKENILQEEHNQSIRYFENDNESSSPLSKGDVGGKNPDEIPESDDLRRGPPSPTAPLQREIMSKAAVTHRFRKLKTPSKCRECDSYVYFQGYDCQDCGLSSHKKCLETLALQCGHKRLPRKMTTFGVDLTQHLMDTNAQVPPLICKCVHEIESRGLKFKGIYRVSSAKPKVERLCQIFENGAELVDLTDIHVPVIANVLKLYLRQLPEPLITCALYRDFIRIAELCPVPGGEPTISEETAVAELRELCRRLPKSHFQTLGFLMHHLKRVGAEHETNNMPASNLAIVLGPTLLWSNEGSTSIATVIETHHQARAIELISTHANEIFGPPESVIPKDYSRYTTTPHHHRQPAREELRGRGGGKVCKTGRRRRQILSTRDGGYGIPQCKHRVEFYREESGSSVTMAGSQESNEDIFGATNSDEDEDNAEPIPPFLLPDGCGKSKKSPSRYRPTSSPPKIIKQSLKNFSGLEGVTPGMLSTQDSLEVVQRLGGGGPLMRTDFSMVRRSVQQEMSMPATTSISAGDRPSKSVKKHSLDEEFFVASDHHHPIARPTHSDKPGGQNLNPNENPRTSQPHYRSQQLLPVGRSSLKIGSPGSGSSTNIQNSSSSVRSCSLSDEAQSLAISQRHRLRGLTSSASHAGMATSLAAGNIAHSSSLSHSLPSEVMNLEENKLKIRVPGLHQPKMASRSHLAATKQSSLDKDDR